MAHLLDLDAQNMGILGDDGSGGGAAAPNYLIDDEFTTNEAAPLASPRTCEPGPGQLTIVDTNSRLSIASSELVANGAVTYDDPYFYSGSLARVCGLALCFDIVYTGNVYAFAGWNPGITMAFKGPANSIGFQHWNVNQYLDLVENNNFLRNSVYHLQAGSNRFLIVLRNAGAHFFAKLPADATWIYLGNDKVNVQANMRISADFGNGTYAAKWNYDNLKAVNLALHDSRFGTDTGLATTFVTSPGIGYTGTMDADGLIDLTWTPQAADVFELSVRRTDDNNRWIIRCDQAGGTIKIIEVDTSVETERASTAQVWNVGTGYRIVVTCDGQVIQPWVNATKKNAYSSAAFNQTATGVKLSHAVSDFGCWPIDVTLPSWLG